jgi:ATP-binding cassette, subfamily C (CFTR/MRP), member 1
VFFSLQVVLAALWALPSTIKTYTSIAESVLALVEALMIGALSYVEHKRSIRPSGLLSGYLFVTLILDVAQARTFWLRQGLQAAAGVFTALLAVKGLILVLEETPKRPLLTGDLKNAAFESTTGIVSRSVFWWLNPLFLQGFHALLSIDDLGSIDGKFDSDRHLAKIDLTWSRSRRPV